ncbi:RTA1 like protein-domain-containing protein [Mycena rosella]|uniref:RTA1 like protein-domain-containing protein n=1 Tax=Mycena rosella TaxID=1033263 RepID=A0AAD7G9K3_MYCRO|nr:RTA1 like protein-domain-containing protein [Mycena rosella]
MFVSFVLYKPVSNAVYRGGFVPNKTLAVTGLAFYGVTAAIQWIQHFKIKPRRPFMLTLTIGMTCMTIGFVLRLIFSDEPSSIAKFIIMTMFILLSPCAFLAVDYMLLSHLAATFDREVTDRCLLLRSSRIVKIFMWSDYVTLSLQGNGGGLQVSKTPTLATVGTALVMTGLVVQAISFVFFTYVLVVFGWRIRKHFPAAWIPSTPRPWRILSRQPIDDWRPLFCVMCVTCVGISIRSIFRIVEFSQGHNGYISVHEEYFYLFDALGLWISMTLFCFVWPTRVLYTPPGHVELQPVLKSTV